ncbi:carbohydrate ABC transporter permease [Pseudactinotalea sp. Z1748]|uniref:carbohydrate ABC transporter permease n=1 Tax=Pseudactinotalea sp. Z1748 TaxID=3413027 RepID=UPI003C7C750C
MIKVINAVLAIAGGVGAVLILFFVFNWLVERLPERWSSRLKPWVFAGPAIAFIGLFLLYPGVRTIILSFANARSTEWVGVQNYVDLLTESAFQQTMINTLLWILVVPTVAVVIGLLVAVLTDRLAPRGEKVTKSLIFLPMAISMVGASTIWRFIYEFRPGGTEQIGLLNALWTGIGGQPQVWLQMRDYRLNSFLLMIILIWLQTGFAMVLLSSAIKAVPEETVEAARIDGATEVQAFFQVVIPQIWGTVITVFVTILIAVMKIFDIVYVMTGGQHNTDVVARRFFAELFNVGDYGKSAAIVVLLMIAVIPVMIYQVRQFRKQEAMG